MTDGLERNGLGIFSSFLISASLKKNSWIWFFLIASELDCKMYFSFFFVISKNSSLFSTISLSMSFKITKLVEADVLLSDEIVFQRSGSWGGWAPLCLPVITTLMNVRLVWLNNSRLLVEHVITGCVKSGFFSQCQVINFTFCLFVVVEEMNFQLYLQLKQKTVSKIFKYLQFNSTIKFT